MKKIIWFTLEVKTQVYYELLLSTIQCVIFGRFELKILKGVGGLKMSLIALYIPLNEMLPNEQNVTK